MPPVMDSPPLRNPVNHSVMEEPGVCQHRESARADDAERQHAQEKVEHPAHGDVSPLEQERNGDDREEHPDDDHHGVVVNVYPEDLERPLRYEIIRLVHAISPRPHARTKRVNQGYYTISARKGKANCALLRKFGETAQKENAAAGRGEKPMSPRRGAAENPPPKSPRVCRKRAAGQQKPCGRAAMQCGRADRQATAPRRGRACALPRGCFLTRRAP